jgi:hypothetical protein
MDVPTLDNRKYLTDKEFDELIGKLKFAYNEAGNIFPKWDETKIINEEQYDKLAPYLFSQSTPFSRKQKHFLDTMDSCFRRDVENLSETVVG